MVIGSADVLDAVAGEKERTGTNEPIGRVVGVRGSVATLAISARPIPTSLRVGSLIKLRNSAPFIIATVAELTSTGAAQETVVAVADLVGELVPSDNGELRFSRGASACPNPDDAVTLATDRDRSVIYGAPSSPNVRIGTLHQDATRSAFLMTDELLAKHFAILGTSGSGKSCTLTLTLSAILAQNKNAHIVLLDPHNEYAHAFAGLANVITVANLQLPFWLLNFEEAAGVLVRAGSKSERDSQRLVLNDAIAWARQTYGNFHKRQTAITVDTPVPYRIHELLHFINDQMGRLGKPDTAIPYLRLRTRIESLRNDRRFAFLFKSEEDVLAEIIGGLMRVPVDGHPLTIVDLSGVPSEIADIMVSTICRTLFDFATWCEREKMPPLLIVCEEAHRYVPSDEQRGFGQTVQIITQIAKEGRKYGIGLGLVAQRPSELALAALSQCGTVFAMRLGSDSDQKFIERTFPDAASEMLRSLPSLPNAQAIVFGEACTIPMRIRFDDLPPKERPRSEGASFSEGWQNDHADRGFVESGVRRWRSQTRN
jgi:uncharacterized protein